MVNKTDEYTEADTNIVSAVELEPSKTCSHDLEDHLDAVDSSSEVDTVDQVSIEQTENEEDHEDPQTSLIAARAEIDTLKDKLLRALAEMENLRRRTERDMKEIIKYSVSTFALEIVRVSDSLALAIAALPESVDEQDKIFSQYVEGIRLVAKQLDSAMGKAGVKKFKSLEQKFDPNIHNAVFEVPATAFPAGTITQVLEEGFFIGDRLLRPASVAVAKPEEVYDEKSINKTNCGSSNC